MDRVIAYMATFPGRKDSFKRAVLSLASQVDALCVYVNSTPESFYYNLPGNVFVTFGEDLNSAGKYFHALNWQGYVLTVDDDILYPENYVKTAIAMVEKYQRKAVISFHGRILDPPVQSFARAKKHYLPFFFQLKEDVRVNHVGDGVMCLHTDCLTTPLDPIVFKDRGYMSDVVVSIEMNKRHIPMYVCKHSSSWLKQLPVKFSLGELLYKNDIKQTELVNESFYPSLI